MNPTNLYAEIQANPNSRAAYRKLVEYYKSCNQDNIASAFLHLMEKKFNVSNSTNTHEEQPRHNPVSD